MKERGKAVETYVSDFSYSSSDAPCRKHPSPSPVGICAHCLKDRLVKLVCSDCGEQRLSSCSCSDVSSYRNSCAANADVGSVGRISFLIENERGEANAKQPQLNKPQNENENESQSEGGVVLLKRSNSTCTAVKRGGIWRIARLFRKKREKESERRSVGGCDEKSELWVLDYMRVSRSRSLCSFRGGSFHDPEELGSDLAFSSAKISDVNGVDSERLSAFSEAEPRKSGFKSGFDAAEISVFEQQKKVIFPVKESDFSRMDESGFIDLKLDLSSESKPELSSSVSELGGNFHGCGGELKKGGSCRVTVNDRGMRKDKKGHRVWRWIFRHHKKSEEGGYKP
ncbi:hypothetical protein NMG60_11036113 [Bertholletia excelsa]